MSIAPGVRVGVYEIIDRLGSGGMGDVWRARDQRLGRDVALKVLPPDLAGDRDRLTRLEREARLLASLNHQNIATLYGVVEVQESEGPSGGVALVMELVEGETLDERIMRAASRASRTSVSGLPTAEALGMARQIADALDAAHENGIVHRDLKPANIKITPAGALKVLDFGLAKSAVPGDGSIDLTAAPTMTAIGTKPGVILGTPAYMSPEQARGLPVDKRTDIWAFGCVLYEMLTGRPPFAGATITDILAGIIEREPDWNALPASTSPHVRRLLARCLDKDPRKRLRDIGDAGVELDAATAVPGADAARSVSSRRTLRWWTIGAAVVTALVGLTAWLAGSRMPRAAAVGASVRLSAGFVEPPYSSPIGGRRLAISNDGSTIAYGSISRLWTRRLDQHDAIAVGPVGVDPFFSPDGAWVGYFRDTGLVKVPIAGGSLVRLADFTARPAGGTWRADGTIVFASAEGLFQVSDQGGTPRVLATPDRGRGERLYAWPEFLPGGDSALFTILPDSRADPAAVASLNLKTGARTVILKGGSSPRYLPTGDLVFMAGATMKAVKFDAAATRIAGDAIPVEGLDIAVSQDNGAADFAIAQTGTLIYLPTSAGQASGSPQSGLRALAWIDRTGKRDRIGIAPGNFEYPRVSPDGKRVALGIAASGNRDVWILDLDRLSLTQLTNGPTEDILPEWSTDGKRLFFASDRSGGDFDIYSQAADGASGPKLEFKAPGFQVPQTPTPDGKSLLVYHQYKDLKLLSLEHPDRLEPLLEDPSADKRGARLSSDGKWLAYESDESGQQFEVFVRPFPNVNAGREKISVNGGRYPLWDPKGNQIFYVNLDGDMMVVPYTVSPSFKAGRASKLFAWRKPALGRSGLLYGISPLDGRFIVTDPIDPQPDSLVEVSVILNWLPELGRRVSGTGR
jgi:hypothetical protein